MHHKLDDHSTGLPSSVCVVCYATSVDQQMLNRVSWDFVKAKDNDPVL